jgi:alpha-L-fucosidase
MPDGTIQPEFSDSLIAVGKWMEKNGASIYGTRGNIIPPKDWGTITMKNKTAYVHILNKPESGSFLFIPELTQKIIKAFLFNSNKEIRFKQQPEGTFIYLNDIPLDNIDTIIQLELK